MLNGAIEPEALFGAALFDPARKTADVRRWLNEEAYRDAHPAHDHEHDHAHGIDSFCLSADHTLDWMTVNIWLGELRHLRGEHLLRVKGILHLTGEDAPVAIHGVHHVFHPPVRLNAPIGDPRSRIVFITRGLDRTEVEAGWRLVCEKASEAVDP